MWTCVTCAENIEDNFADCWNCGTSRDGTPDPNFTPVEDPADYDEPTAAELEAQIAKRFKCSKCGHSESSMKRIATTGDGPSTWIELQHRRFLVVSCASCGYSELYDAKILGTRSNLEDFLGFLFGE